MGGNASAMTGPDYTKPADETPEGAAVTGSLAAASQEDENAGDPLGPLNAVTEDEGDDQET